MKKNIVILGSTGSIGKKTLDIIRSNKGPLLLEVNSSPGLEGIESITGKDIANAIILAIEKKLKLFSSRTV